eukprot:2485936-Rhodomonas_salina.1
MTETQIQTKREGEGERERTRKGHSHYARCHIGEVQVEPQLLVPPDVGQRGGRGAGGKAVSYTHLRAHETEADL